jgi:alkylation response protein AidB-like acyl-CoA dehydrogenase
VFAPKGRAVHEGETLRVSGRWQWASGSEHCDWLMGGCVLEDAGLPEKLPSGRADIRLVLFPAGEVEIVDTWSVSGLRGTGSHDISVQDVEVPIGRSASVIAHAPHEAGPLYAFPIFGLLSLAIAAAGLGIARGAVDDLHGLAGTKRPALGARTLAARADTQGRVARAEARLRAARALVDGAVDDAWAGATGEGAVTVEQRAALRMAASHAMAESAAIVDEMYALAGGSAVFESSPLQRRFRDVHVATQHMLVSPASWELAGRVLLGVPADTDQL